MLEAIKKIWRKKTGDTAPDRAYDIWADSYDSQPDNLMLYLDEIVFAELLKDVNLSGKKIGDIGCGTGRHWQKLYAATPALVHGYDVSQGMLQQLKKKYPRALVSHISGDILPVNDSSHFDCIISTLTVAHILNIEKAITDWDQRLSPKAELIITDFHPDLLAVGGKRTFKHGHEQVAITNYIHPLEKIKTICKQHGLIVKKELIRYIDVSVKDFYQKQNALPVYEKYKGMPVIYGLHLIRQDGIA